VPSDRATEQEHRPDEASRGEADAAREAQVPQADLRQRLERLPTEHPSSPYDSDGCRRPPPPDLADLELPFPEGRGDDAVEQTPTADHPLRPLTDDEFAEHVHVVRDRLEQARIDGLATNERYTVDPKRQVWSAERVAAHDEIIEDLYGRAADVPSDRCAIIAGGPPGAGKSTVLGAHAEIDRSRFLTLDPDEIKEEIARRGLIPQVEGLSPMEASDLVHEESSRITKLLAARAQADGKNIIWDITMSSQSSTERRIDDLRSDGYSDIEAVFVDIPPQVSEARAMARYRIEQEKYRNGEGEGGRFVPPELIERQADPKWGSVNRKTFEAVKGSCNRWSLYDNSVDGQSPRLMDSSEAVKKVP
jgi:predicted ABC-type ATPase